jgi:hypothetical protein
MFTDYTTGNIRTQAENVAPGLKPCNIRAMKRNGVTTPEVGLFLGPIMLQWLVLLKPLAQMALPHDGGVAEEMPITITNW